MKKIKKIVTYILVFAISITNTNIIFANNVDVSNLYLESESIKEEEKLLKDIYNGLGAEAREIFLEEIKGDFELQKLHKEYVDKNYSLRFNRINVSPKIGIEEGFYPKAEIRSVAVATGFAALNLPGPVLYALKAVSAGFVAAAADGPLPFGDAVLITASVALAATLAIYWSSVAPKWPQIVRVFERQFSDSISTVRRVLAKVKGDTESKVEKEYQKDKKNGTKTDNHSTQNGGSLKKKGKPNSSRDLKDSSTGKVKQRRYYDKNGNADMDIDYTNHGNPKQHPKVPHRHNWKNGIRGKGY